MLKRVFQDCIATNFCAWLTSCCGTSVVILQVSNQMLKHAKHVYPFNTPMTKEAYYYRMIFEKHFPQVSTALSQP